MGLGLGTPLEPDPLALQDCPLPEPLHQEGWVTSCHVQRGVHGPPDSFSRGPGILHEGLKAGVGEVRQGAKSSPWLHFVQGSPECS